MAAPNSRMGFKQASQLLRQFGMRPCRTEKCPHLAGYRSSGVIGDFAAVKLQKGLSDEAVGVNDVKHNADTMTALVKLVTLHENGDSRASDGLSRYNAAQNREIADAENRLNGQEATETGDAAAKLAALQGLLGGGVDENKVRAMIADQTDRAIRDAVGGTVDAMDKLASGIQDQIGQAVKQASGMIPVRIEIKVRDRVKPVEGQHGMFPVLLEEMALGQSVFMSGPAGSGKTTGCVEACKILERPYYIMRAVQDPFELLGFIDANGVYQESPIYRWAKDPGSVLIMDEMDRSNPKALIALNAVWNGVATFPTGQIEIPEDNLIVATANTWGTGADAEYVGSSRLDAATLNRFPSRIDWQYDLGLETRIAVANGGDAEEARYAQGIRDKLNDKRIRVIWSPRDTVAHCKRVASGMPRAESIRRSVLCGLDAAQLAEIS